MHAPASFGKAFAIGITLNATFVVVEVAYGLFAHSLALVADAGHNLGDVFGLLLAWGATWWARRTPTLRHTYGWGRFSMLAALTNAMFLLASVGVIAWEAILRLLHPAPIAAGTMIVVSLVGIAINGTTALLFMSGRKGDLNIRSTYQHMAADAVLSAGVAVAGAVILFTHWLWVDPAMSLILVAVIVIGTWNLLRESLDLVIDAVPSGVEVDSVRDFLKSQAGVVDVHHLHIWGLSTTETALTAHIVLAHEHTDNELLQRISAELRERYHIGHATLQLESSRSPFCEGRECAVTQTASETRRAGA